MPAIRKHRDCRNASDAPFAAIAVSLLTNSVLRTQTAYPARAGAAAALFSVPVLVLVSSCFCLCWQRTATPFLRVLWAALLFLSSVREVLRITVFLQLAYPGTVTPVLCAFLLFLPALYLRRGVVLAQTGHILLWLMAGGGLLLFGSVLPQLRFENLQLIPLAPPTLIPAVCAQLQLYPEYFLPALWLGGTSKQAGITRKLPALGVGTDFLVHLLPELFFGAAAANRSMPLYTAACSGAFSVFTRLEWLQLLLWCGAVGVKLALFFCAVARLLGRPNSTAEDEGIPLKLFFYYGGSLLFFCILFAKNVVLPTILCSGGMWALAALTMIGGAAAWLCQKIGRSC